VSGWDAWTRFEVVDASWPANYSETYSGDFNRDGKTDLLVVDPTGGALVKL
jgi:hypothetical protein